MSLMNHLMICLSEIVMITRKEWKQIEALIDQKLEANQSWDSTPNLPPDIGSPETDLEEEVKEKAKKKLREKVSEWLKF